jgi:hypothetical protein
MELGHRIVDGPGSDIELEDFDIELLRFSVTRENLPVNAPEFQETLAGLAAKLLRSKVEVTRFRAERPRFHVALLRCEETLEDFLKNGQPLSHRARGLGPRACGRESRGRA